MRHMGQTRELIRAIDFEDMQQRAQSTGCVRVDVVTK